MTRLCGVPFGPFVLLVFCVSVSLLPARPRVETTMLDNSTNHLTGLLSQTELRKLPDLERLIATINAFSISQAICMSIYASGVAHH